jgi:hypothetical protein
MDVQQERRDLLEFLEEIANWNVPYSARKVKGQHQRQIAAQKILADIYFGSTTRELSNSVAEPRS